MQVAVPVDFVVRNAGVAELQTLWTQNPYLY